MKDILVAFLVLMQKLINNKIFWAWIFFVTILWARPSVLDKIFSNMDSIKELSYVIGGLVVGKVLK